MARKPTDRERREEFDRLINDIQSAWLEGSDADLSNLVDTGLQEPKWFALALVRHVADERVLLRLSVQRALVGAVCPAVYGVCAGLRGTMIELTFYVAEAATADELEALRAVGSEVIADFTDNFRIEDRIVRIADPQDPLRTTGIWVHLQRGLTTIDA